MSETEKGQARPWFSGDAFVRLVVLLIGFVALLSTVAGYQQVVDNGYSTRAYNEGQQFALQSFGTRVRGEVLSGYSWADAYRTWLALDTQAVLAVNEGDETLRQNFLTARDRIANLTPLLQPPYFDANTQENPKLRAYEANLFIEETTVQRENFLNANRTGAAWSEKSGKHIVHLTLYTVILFLYAFGLTMAGRVRWMFVAFISLIALATTLWMIQVILTPVTSTPQAAIQAYAKGMGLVHQQGYAEAQPAFDEAIALAPDFANALYERANVNHLLGEYEKAAADYAGAIEAGRRDTNVYWNAGWNAYIRGDYPQSIAHTEQALLLSPEQLALHFNLALSQLAAGQIIDAKITYAVGVQLAEQIVANWRAAGKEPPTSLWWYLDTAVFDLSNLYDCVEIEVCEGTPPREAVAFNFQISPTAQRFQRSLKSLAVTLEYHDQVVNRETEPEVTELAFSTGLYDAGGKLVSYVPLGDSAAPLRFGMAQESQDAGPDTSLVRANSAVNRDIFVTFQYDGIADGELIVMKVYLNDRESSGLRLALPWSLGETGEASLPLSPGRTFTLSPGDYRVDFFVDGKFVQTGTFKIDA